MLNLGIITPTPSLECLHCIFVCKSNIFHSSIFKLCIMIEDVHRRRRSRAKFGRVSSIIGSSSVSTVHPRKISRISSTPKNI